MGSTAAVLRLPSRPLVTVARAATVPARPEPGVVAPSPAVARGVIGGGGMRAQTGTVSIGRSAAGPIATPQQRWRAAVAARPLEAPRPFPAALRPLVTRFAGTANRPSYTTGAATRQALSAAGAHGATTGSVVHLADPPSTAALRGGTAALRVLAHELTHARQPVGRPRFLLRVPSGAADADERTAATAGEQAQAAYSMDADEAGGVADGVTGRSVGSGVAGGFGRGRAFAGTTGSATAARNMAGGSATGAAAGRSAVRKSFQETAGAVSAGVVDRLPVGGAAVGAAGGSVGAAGGGIGALGGGVGDVLGSQSGSAFGSASQAAAGASLVDTALVDALSQSRALAGDDTALTLLAALSGATGSLAGESGGLGAAEAIPAAGTETVPGATGADGAVSAVGQPGQASAAAAGADHAGASDHGADLDRIVEALEQRLLRQLERRGGRYAGVF